MRIIVKPVWRGYQNEIEPLCSGEDPADARPEGRQVQLARKVGVYVLVANPEKSRLVRTKSRLPKTNRIKLTVFQLGS